MEQRANAVNARNAEKERKRKPKPRRPGIARRHRSDQAYWDLLEKYPKGIEFIWDPGKRAYYYLSNNFTRAGKEYTERVYPGAYEQEVLRYEPVTRKQRANDRKRKQAKVQTRNKLDFSSLSEEAYDDLWVVLDPENVEEKTGYPTLTALHKAANAFYKRVRRRKFEAGHGQY